MTGTFNFFGLPRELRAMIYQSTFNAATDEGTHIFEVNTADKDDFRFEFPPNLTLRQLCKAARTEYDEEIACKAILMMVASQSMPADLVSLPSTPRLPKMLYENIRDLKLVVHVEDSVLTKSYDFTWLSKFSNLSFLDIVVVKAPMTIPFCPKSYIMKGIMSDIYSCVSAGVVVEWVSYALDPEALNENELLKAEELKVVAATMSHLQGQAVDEIEDVDDSQQGSDI